MRALASVFIAMTLAAFPVAGCLTVAPPTEPAPAASSLATPAPTVTPTVTSEPATPLPTQRGPRPVVMSTGVPATVPCELPADRTLRLTLLAGTMAYGYDARLTPFSYPDSEGDPRNASRDLVGCDLDTGVVTRLASPVETDVFIADFDRGRLLLNGYADRRHPDPWLLDVATGQATPLKDFDDRAVFPVGIDDDEVVGEQTLESPEWQIQPAMLDLRPGGSGFRVLTSYQIGVSAQRLRPLDIKNQLVVGLVSDDSQGYLPAIWIYRVDGPTGMDEPVVPEAFRGLQATPTGFDGRTVVGNGLRTPHGRPQPFAWTLGDADITWLPLPVDQKGGIAWDVDGGRVVGLTYGTNEDGVSKWHREKRGIVWDLASGKFLDLGTGPPELSGTLATEASLSPQSLAVDVQGNRVLGFLGEGCREIAETAFYCSAASFGGTPVVWDIGDWVASIAP